MALDQYTLKDNRLFIRGLGVVEKPKGKPLSAEVVQKLLDNCEANEMTSAKAIQKYLVVFEESPAVELAEGTESNDDDGVEVVE